ncbi:hypothetical protein SAMN05216198_1636 [Halopseudomonas litoralis]|uniref:Uncharacterized protein n=1 Tax=Halopseudomonas litoralis TaxID=797277 RepID=A0A1H1R296_9GAMM|nr:hypothetical protein [Halopseudomonas litoralis]SDS29655.1 hypothetical protein SAMN05216198_1636 [Halopseudomonas litoralis]
MIFRVTLMRRRGVPFTPKELSKDQGKRVDVAINHESCVMGRSSVVASIRGAWPLSEPPWPELMDCQLHSMAPNGMVLTGTEEIDGVMYAQSWLCRAE